MSDDPRKANGSTNPKIKTLGELNLLILRKQIELICFWFVVL